VTRIAAVNAVLPVHSYPQNEITEAFARMCATPAVSHQLLQRLHTSASVRTRHLALPLERYPTLENFGEANDAFLEVAVERGEHGPVVRATGEVDLASRRELDGAIRQACEAASGRPGAEIVVTRLSEVLFVQAVRAHLAALPEGARGWVGALRDPPVARALALIHRHPERPWTVESLGRAVGLSRSQFAARFAAAVGEPPLAYLSGWRMHRARSLLRDGTVRMGRIAALLGYGSEAAFSTAFKRWTGTAPGAFRKTARLEADAAREAA